MAKVKLFKGVEQELAALEADINHWAESTRAKILSICGNIAPQSGSGHQIGSTSFGGSDILVIITYEEGSAG